MSSWPVPAQLVTELERAAEAEGAALRVVTGDADRRHVAALIAHASIEQSLTPELVEETAAWSGRGRAARDGVPAVNVPLGPDGTFPVRDFAAREQRQDTLGRDENDGTVLALLATVDSSPSSPRLRR